MVTQSIVCQLFAGFDANDLNVQGYESCLLHDVEACIDGPLRLRCRDFASSTTQVGSGRLEFHQSGSSELMTVDELETVSHWSIP